MSVKAPWLLLLVLAVAGCRNAPAEMPPREEFSELLQPTDVVRLEETAADPIVGVERITVGPGGVLVVPDRRADRVRLFDPGGKIIGVVGRRGSGPGELKGLADAFLDSAGRLYTSDSGNGRIMRFDSDLNFDTAFVSPGVFTFRLFEMNAELIAATFERGRAAVWRLDQDGRRLAELALPDSAAWSVPYWGSVLGRDLSLFAEELIVSNSLLYPVWRIGGGDDPDSLGYPPPSFREAPRPVRGQFVGASQADVQEWLRSFTVIDRVIPYRDSLLFVIHAEYRPAPGQPWKKVHTAADIYDRAGTKLYSDVPLPGHVLNGGQFLYILSGKPPGGWEVTRYSWVE